MLASEVILDIPRGECLGAKSTETSEVAGEATLVRFCWCEDGVAGAAGATGACTGGGGAGCGSGGGDCGRGISCGRLVAGLVKDLIVTCWLLTVFVCALEQFERERWLFSWA